MMAAHRCLWTLSSRCTLIWPISTAILPRRRSRPLWNTPAASPNFRTATSIASTSNHRFARLFTDSQKRISVYNPIQCITQIPRINLYNPPLIRAITSCKFVVSYREKEYAQQVPNGRKSRDAFHQHSTTNGKPQGLGRMFPSSLRWIKANSSQI